MNHARTQSSVRVRWFESDSESNSEDDLTGTLPSFVFRDKAEARARRRDPMRRSCSRDVRLDR